MSDLLLRILTHAPPMPEDYPRTYPRSAEPEPDFNAYTVRRMPGTRRPPGVALAALQLAAHGYRPVPALEAAGITDPRTVGLWTPVLAGYADVLRPYDLEQKRLWAEAIAQDHASWAIDYAAALTDRLAAVAKDGDGTLTRSVRVVDASP